MILALDPATTTGFAYGNPGDEPRWGSRAFEGKSTGAVVGLFRHWLVERVATMHPTLIVFEAPYIPRPNARAPMNAKTLRRLLGMVAQIEACAWELNIRYYEATIFEISRFFVGTQRLPRGGKKAATIAMCRRYGWAVGNDNEADALALWALAEATVAPRLAARRGVGPLFVPDQLTTDKRTPRRQARAGALLFPPVDDAREA